ncbi:MAG: YceD family protein, partial [Burkholderiaceae bacterium]
MSQTIVDGFAFCRQGEQREGSTRVAQLPRLAADAASQQGEIHWSFQGGRHAKGYPQLQMSVKGEVSLVCQRCLLPMLHAIDTQALLVLAQDESDADATEAALDDETI